MEMLRHIYQLLIDETAAGFRRMQPVWSCKRCRNLLKEKIFRFVVFPTAIYARDTRVMNKLMLSNN